MPHCVRLLFPHQLFRAAESDDSDLILLIEHPLFFTQYPFHIQKLMLHHAGLRAFAEALRGAGKRAALIELERCEQAGLCEALREHVMAGTEVVVYDLVDDWLERDVAGSVQALGGALRVEESPGFLCARSDLAAYRKRTQSRKTLQMAHFYQWQRQRLGILVDEGGDPTGGAWSFDADNRKRLPRDVSIPAPAAVEYTDQEQAWLGEARRRYADHPGGHAFRYPLTHRQAEAALDDFLAHRFRLFGDYEDALSTQEGTLFHSLLSSSLNCGLLTPDDVIARAIEYADGHAIPLNALEGFVRQIIGWREFMRATYVWGGRRMRTRNFFRFKRPLPPGFWDASTGLIPLDAVLRRTLATAYAHHIERLMVLGTFLLLTETDPDEVYAWFMSLFIDAYDWVMVPNVYAMSQYADGGTMTTKPYLCGSNYLRKMSDFPKGPWEPLWDALYWRFVDRRRRLFLRNPRLSMSVHTFDRFPPEKQAELRAAASEYLTTSGPASRPGPTGTIPL